MSGHLYENDLPDGLDLGPVVAIDCEMMGLNPHRDRLCLVEMSGGDGHAHMVRVEKKHPDADFHEAPNLGAILKNPDVLKLFHFGRLDIAVLCKAFGILARPVWCTKIASKLARTYTNQHGLKALLKDLLDMDISKTKQSSYWGAEKLTDEQLDYAATDVLHLHELRKILQNMLEREGRADLARECFDFLPFRARLDLAGWPDIDIFAH